MKIAKHKGLKRVYFALLNSGKGFIWLINNEAAFKQEFIISLLLIMFSFFLNVSALEQLLLISVLGIVLIVEIVNTAIEATVDRIGLEHHPLSGLAKDLGSLAVLFSLLIALATWVVVLWTI
ncbi:diacylglycerol kinase [Colwellia ponticola]|uniref:Diacylglycerol kinase n=1 Tax=Colwellia ponticola TaxID=2304625 RepID=A0A8H2JMU3_9GAMM|nr:diacylglycerol kinase [Colwellia ponticola]TMM45040.1 diacylglycerol kinase [Colwellia ponticola]